MQIVLECLINSYWFLTNLGRKGVVCPWYVMNPCNVWPGFLHTAFCLSLSLGEGISIPLLDKSISIVIDHIRILSIGLELACNGG